MKISATIAVVTILWWLLAGGEGATTADTFLCVMGIVAALIIAIINNDNHIDNWGSPEQNDPEK